MEQNKNKKKIKVTIVTPEKNIFEGDVDYIRVPAKSGSIGVLPRHIPIIAQLKVGVVKLVDGQKETYIGVCRGFFEFLYSRANILTELAIPSEKGRIKETIEELKKKHDITQEITDETRKVFQAIAEMKTLRRQF
jgi:F-type H+-transporting ATPase subunit epsilon